MPLNNSINKNSDTFFATSNITANFTSPVSTTVGFSTYTNSFTTILQSPNLSTLTSEYYGIDSAADGNGNTILFTRANGTKATPLNLGGPSLIGQIRFDYRTGNTYRAGVRISGFGGVSGVSWLQFNNPQAGSTVAIRFQSLNLYATGSFSSIRNFDSTSSNTPNTLSEVFRNGTGFNQFNLTGSTTGTNLGGLHLLYSNNTSLFGATVALIRSRSTNLSPSAIVNGDVLGSLNYGGFTTNTSGETVVAASIDAIADGTILTSVIPGRLIFSTANAAGTVTEAMRIDSAQRITQPLQPSFSASLSADVANATGDGTAYTIAFNTEQYDQGSNFAANTFTAPIAGRYRFNWTISVDDLLVGHTKMEVTVGGQTVCRVNPYAIADSDGFCLLNGSVDLSLAASATVTMVVTISGSTKTVTVKGTTTSGTFLSGQLQV